MFYTAVLLGFIQSNRIANSWNDISVYWASVEWSQNIPNMSRDKTLRNRMYRVTLVIIMSGSGITNAIITEVVNKVFRNMQNMCL